MDGRFGQYPTPSEMAAGLLSELEAPQEEFLCGVCWRTRWELFVPFLAEECLPFLFSNLFLLLEFGCR